MFEARLSLFGPEADRTRNELVAFMRQNQENVEVHRALAWAYLSHHDLDNAVEHIRRALALDDSDPAMHYLYARWINQGEEDNIRIESAEPRMSTELKAALKLDPNYAAALELLGLAELSGGDTKPARANLQRASALRPRSDRYYLNLARADEAAGNLDEARNLVLYARAGSDAAVSAEAAAMLNELDHQKERQQQWKAMGIQPDAGATPSKYDNLQDAIAEDEKAEATGTRAWSGTGHAKDRVHEGPHCPRRMRVSGERNPQRELGRAHLADARGRPQHGRSHRRGSLRLQLARCPRIHQLQAQRKSSGRHGIAGDTLIDVRTQ